MIYQEEQEIREKQPENASFATIAQVYEDGVTLLFGSEKTPSQKRYQVNSFAVFHQGDRVFLTKDSGTYVVLFPVGAPKSSFRADTAAQADKAAVAATADRADAASHAASADDAAHADCADTATRLTTARSISLTGDVTASGSFSGASNLSMAATGVKANAVKDQGGPSSRSIQFRVTAAGKLQFKSSYYNNANWYNMDGTQA
ncbi:MAG TPA: hypothetical protein DEP43_06220 [Ruminococcaceae bacterium]|nr:hypothetical protein [Oscillospiraceae bacterium]MDD5920173.1 hypothetical protein [Oscillospiraceae bacterium]HAO69949.1 hypothetical protein [Oscillospiraceae bacterium]HCB65540.1 hypothetical protein [Oscillospiraceae bacterium]